MGWGGRWKEGTVVNVDVELQGAGQAGRSPVWFGREQGGPPHPTPQRVCKVGEESPSLLRVYKVGGGPPLP